MTEAHYKVERDQLNYITKLVNHIGTLTNLAIETTNEAERMELLEIVNDSLLCEVLHEIGNAHKWLYEFEQGTF